ncbi:MAG: TAT-variant-translocated molybdopterin oxidoreductase, partial [Cyclobacteriaceae bacterium]
MGKSTYWKGIEELNQDTGFKQKAQNEFTETLPSKEDFESLDAQISDTTRRDFLKAMGFTVAAVSLAACEAPTRYAIPYVNKPADVDPGIANWYASTYVGDGEAIPVVVKTREGRPIKIEGNTESTLTNGGVGARAQASVLSLYDSSRLKNFQHKKRGDVFNGVTAAAADKFVTGKLDSISAEGGKIALVSNTIASPTTKKVIADFKAKYPTVEHVSYDAVSVSGLAKANNNSVPAYDFSKANVIVSFGADFLGTWISPVAFSSQYAKNRKVSRKTKTMSKHYQFESNLSLSGSNADERIMVKPSEEPYYILGLYNIIAREFGARILDIPQLNAKGEAKLKEAAQKLIASTGKSLVISSSNDDAVQYLVRRINELLGNYESTLSSTKPSYIKQGDDTQMIDFVSNLEKGAVKAVIFLESNPVYDFHLGENIEAALPKTDLVVSITDREEETSTHADVICASQHYLESWGDVELQKGSLSLIQPTIRPLYKGTRSKEETLLAWAGNSTSYYEYLKAAWMSAGNGQKFWDKSLHDGVASGTSM